MEKSERYTSRPKHVSPIDATTAQSVTQTVQSVKHMKAERLKEKITAYSARFHVNADIKCEEDIVRGYLYFEPGPLVGYSRMCLTELIAASDELQFVPAEDGRVELRLYCHAYQTAFDLPMDHENMFWRKES